MNTPPYQVKWYKAQQVLHIVVNGNMEREQVLAMEAESFACIKTAPNVVHAIVDLRALHERPPHISQAYWQIKRPSHPNQGTSVVILPMNPVVQFITDTVMKAMGLNVEFCNDFAEAERKIDNLLNGYGKRKPRAKT